MKKVLISDEVTEHVISRNSFDATGLEQDLCEYPFVLLEDGKRFYFNRFVFI